MSTIEHEVQPLVDISGAAVRLGVSVRHVRGLVAERRVPFIKWGHLLRFDPIELERWIADHRVEPSTATRADDAARGRR